MGAQLNGDGLQAALVRTDKVKAVVRSRQNLIDFPAAMTTSAMLVSANSPRSTTDSVNDLSQRASHNPLDTGSNLFDFPPGLELPPHENPDEVGDEWDWPCRSIPLPIRWIGSEFAAQKVQHLIEEVTELAAGDKKAFEEIFWGAEHVLLTDPWYCRAKLRRAAREAAKAGNKTLQGRLEYLARAAEWAEKLERCARNFLSSIKQRALHQKLRQQLATGLPAQRGLWDTDTCKMLLEGYATDAIADPELFELIGPCCDLTAEWPYSGFEVSRFLGDVCDNYTRLKRGTAPWEGYDAETLAEGLRLFLRKIYWPYEGM
jgi:hypothetical protein